MGVHVFMFVFFPDGILYLFLLSDDDLCYFETSF